MTSDESQQLHDDMKAMLLAIQKQQQSMPTGVMTISKFMAGIKSDIHEIKTDVSEIKEWKAEIVGGGKVVKWLWSAGGGLLIGAVVSLIFLYFQVQSIEEHVDRLEKSWTIQIH